MTIDSLRADHCGYWGYDRDTSPTLDSMAEDGIVFDNAIAPGSKTPESMPAIFTGEFPAGDLDSVGMESWRKQIYPHMRAQTTIPEWFADHGYTTGAFTPNGFTTDYFGFDIGFDHFEDFLSGELRPNNLPSAVQGLLKLINSEGNWKRWEQYYDQVLRFIDQATEPFFLWVFLLDVHSPYLVPREYRTENSWIEMMYANWRRRNADGSESTRQRLISAYDDTIRYFDEFLRQLRRDTEEWDPILVVHSDHGEAFGEHGNYGHGDLLYEENIRVPLVISNVDTNESISSPISLRQLPGLLRRFSDPKVPDDGLELSEFSYPSVISRSDEGGSMSVRTDRFKLIRTGGSSELYDLQSDPNETEDMSDDHPEATRLLGTVLDLHRKSNREKRKITDSASELVGRVTSDGDI